jgi:hypothetical protein
MRYHLRTLLIVIAVIGALLAVFRVASRYIKPSLIYGLRVEFAELPPDDATLEEWLRQQPGVIKVSVNREPKAIRIVWLMSRDLNGYPPIPDCRQNFERFGYKGIKRYEQE